MSQQKTVFLTGASGFVGQAFLRHWLESERGPILALSRAPLGITAPNLMPVEVGSAGLMSESLPLQGVDVVVHCAGRAHVMKDSAEDPLQAFRNVNVLGSLNIARQAAASGVKRFIFISSVKVNGEETQPGVPFTSDDPPAPADFYGQTKLEAENALRSLAEESGMEVVIIRPPLVYGPGVKGNFASLARAVGSGIPLPFGNVKNKRSLISVTNLVDLMAVCVDHPDAANQVLLASDERDVSTSELLRLCAQSMGKRARLLPVPTGILRSLAQLFGKKGVADRLLGFLQVDSEPTRSRLHWQPPLSVEQGIHECFRKTTS